MEEQMKAHPSPGSPLSSPLSSPPTTPCSPTPHPASPTHCMGLNNPELLKELKQPHSLKHIPLHSGLTTVFYGRGRKIAVSQNAPVLCSSSSSQHLHNGAH
ncbi:hypothetical protein SRHO_G00141540 [Serrasalmus rhombeus]